MQRSGRSLIGVRLHGVADFVGVLLDGAVEGQPHEGCGLIGGKCLVLGGTGGYRILGGWGIVGYRIAATAATKQKQKGYQEEARDLWGVARPRVTHSCFHTRWSS